MCVFSRWLSMACTRLHVLYMAVMLHDHCSMSQLQQFTGMVTTVHRHNNCLSYPTHRPELSLYTVHVYLNHSYGSLVEIHCRHPIVSPLLHVLRYRWRLLSLVLGNSDRLKQNKNVLNDSSLTESTLEKKVSRTVVQN